MDEPEWEKNHGLDLEWQVLQSKTINSHNVPSSSNLILTYPWQKIALVNTEWNKKNIGQIEANPEKGL